MDRSGDNCRYQAGNRILLRFNIGSEAELSKSRARDGTYGREEEAVKLFEISLAAAVE